MNKKNIHDRKAKPQKCFIHGYLNLLTVAQMVRIEQQNLSVASSESDNDPSPKVVGVFISFV